MGMARHSRKGEEHIQRLEEASWKLVLFFLFSERFWARRVLFFFCKYLSEFSGEAYGLGISL